VQTTVGVFFQHIKVCDVILITVRGKVAEEPSSQVRVIENEPAEVAVEMLNSSAERGCVEVWTVSTRGRTSAQEGEYFGGIAETIFAKRFLQRNDSIATR